MRPLEGRGLPLVVLFLVAGSPVMLDAAMTLSAMYGDLTREPSAQADGGASGSGTTAAAASSGSSIPTSARSPSCAAEPHFPKH